jgi:hypothetical protein
MIMLPSILHVDHWKIMTLINMTIDLGAIMKLKKQVMEQCQERIEQAKFATTSNTLSLDNNCGSDDSYGISSILKKRRGL